MNIYEMVVMYDLQDFNNGKPHKTDRRYFQAESDDVAKTVAKSSSVVEKYGEYQGVSVRLTRIDAFPTYSETGVIAPQREDHILRHHWPDYPTD